MEPLIVKNTDRKVYFASDCHFGVPDYQSSRERETRFVKWLDGISTDAGDIFLLGDIFDFWFEYRSVIPKGYSRLLGKFADLSDAGVQFHYFTGNHDMWIKDYFSNEFGFTTYKDPVKMRINDKNFFIGHGDGMYPGDYGYKFIRKVFRFPLCRWLYSTLHPSLATAIAAFFSETSKEFQTEDIYPDEKGLEKVFSYIHRRIGDDEFDYYVMGHWHVPIQARLANNALYINTGDWIRHFTYAEYDGNNLQLKKFRE